MSYVLRDVTKTDEKFFENCGVKSPFGGRLGSSYFMVENIDEDVKMIPIGGQGNMDDKGVKWSEMAAYCAIVWKGNACRVEYYKNRKCIDNTPKHTKHIITYQITEICTYGCSEMDKDEVINVAKKCFEAYGTGGSTTATCEKVMFLDTEVRWG